MLACQHALGLRAVRRIGLVLALGGVVLFAHGAAAQPLGGGKCRTLSVLRFQGTLYFHHRLELPRPALARRQGVALERACDDRSNSEPAPWVSVPVYALRGIRTAVAVAPGRRQQVVFYDPYLCSPRLGERRFLRCLRRH
jgi:hypothetical protein